LERDRFAAGRLSRHADQTGRDDRISRKYLKRINENRGTRCRRVARERAA
jgi:hypothetical protein